MASHSGGVAVSAVSLPLTMSLSQISSLPDLSETKTSFLPSHEKAGRWLLPPDRVSCSSLPDVLPLFRLMGNVQRSRRLSSVVNTRLPSAARDGPDS